MKKFERSRDVKKSLRLGKYEKYNEWLNNQQIIKNSDCNGKKRLRVINLHPGKNVSTVDIAFFESRIIQKAKYFEDRIKPQYNCCFGIYHLMNHIPVFLVSHDKMPNNSKEFDNSNPDYLGFYTRSKPSNIPAIFLCIERIEECIKDSLNLISQKISLCTGQIKTYLISIILAHEFAHALMDVCLNKHICNSNFCNWIEEPLANKIALIFSEGHPKFHEFTEMFIINSQIIIDLEYNYTVVIILIGMIGGNIKWKILVKTNQMK